MLIKKRTWFSPDPNDAQLAVLFSRAKSVAAINHQSTIIFFSYTKSASAKNHQLTIQTCMEKMCPVRLAYQPPASGTFLSEQNSHQ
jgi:hypothetical protein